ncbi:hypothetical protein BJX62DRAFT_230143 [Aspergillus germanicus]
MDGDYKAFEDLPYDIWLSIKDFLRPPDIENLLNTGSKIWSHIFKDLGYLEYAKTFPHASPVLIGYGISSFRSELSRSDIYLALVVRDWSGDLRYERDRFFAALVDGWTYDEARKEVSLPSGIILNVYDLFVSGEEVFLPVEKIFLNRKGGLYSEYCYYDDKTIQVLGPPDILGRATHVRRYTGILQPRAPFETPAYKGRMIREGCRLRLSNEDPEHRDIHIRAVHPDGTPKSWEPGADRLPQNNHR